MGIMKTQPISHYTEAFKRTELFVVLGIVVVSVVVMLLPALAAAKRKSARIGCIGCLSQINLAFKTWEGDNSDKFPMQFALTNSEAMKLISRGGAYVLWQTMSNELSTPKVLRCPADSEHTEATNFNIGFSDANISYFFCLEAAGTYPQMILDGDDNLAIDGVRVKPGILNLPVSGSLTWTKERHRGVGNIGMADCSVLQATSDSLTAAVINATNGAPVTTYRWVIP